MPPHPDPAAVNFTSTTHNDTYPAIAPANQQGRTVLITGASKGIGRETAVSFAKAGAANIIIAARSSLDEVEKEVLDAVSSSSSKPEVFKWKLDVSSESSVDEAVKAVQEKFGKVDIIINNAGYLEEWKLIGESDIGEWWKTWEINIKGVYLVTRAFMPLLLKGKEKTIINVSSAGAHRVRAGASAYQMSKFTLLRLSEFTAEEYGEKGVICIAIHPGGVPTALAKNMPEQMHAVLTETPALAADTMVWLTQKRREWLSGRYVSVMWDMPELEKKEKEVVEDDKLKMRIVI